MLGSMGTRNIPTIKAPCPSKESVNHFGRRSSAPIIGKVRSRKLIVGAEPFSAIVSYLSSDGGRVTIPTFSMPASLIAAIVFMTKP